MTLERRLGNAEFGRHGTFLMRAKDRCDPESSARTRLFASDLTQTVEIFRRWIVMFLEFFRPLVDAGMVFVTMPPLFVVSQGDTRIYCQSEDDRDVAVAELKKNSSKKVEVQRNKGPVK